MTSVILVEFRLALLEIRQELLESLGHPIVSVQGMAAAKRVNVSKALPGVIIIGHRASRHDRQELIRHFRHTALNVPILSLLGRDDKPFDDADYNCPADDPPLWIRTVTLALRGIE